MQWKWRINQRVEEKDEDPWRWLLHKRDDEEHVEDVEDASFCHNTFSCDYCNIDVYVDP